LSNCTCNREVATAYTNSVGDFAVRVGVSYRCRSASADHHGEACPLLRFHRRGISTPTACWGASWPWWAFERSRSSEFR